MRVLVVGGTGPTGPHVVQGLLGRGYRVTILHRGAHELPELAEVEHIHADPHFRPSIEDAVESRVFDTVVAMYGRLRILATIFAGRCERFVGIGGVPVYAGYFPRVGMPGLPIPVTEAHPVVRYTGEDPALVFSSRLADAEEAVFRHHPGATVLRFPMIYGPNNARPAEWSVVRRVRDGRPHMILPDGGFQIHSRCAARNAAAFVLAVIDRPGVAAGQIYNCGDQSNWSLRQWAESIVNVLGARLEMISIPGEIAVEAATTLMPLGNTTAAHCVLSIEKAGTELGYQPVIAPGQALEEVVAWCQSGRLLDSAASPALTDRFDYPTEDALIAAYQAAAAHIADTVEQHPQPPIHSMAHPKSPGTSDHRGR
jgi:nucleoside-diphosphate-sugar epimerase